MKPMHHAVLALANLVAIGALAGCGDNKQISEVKALPFADTNMTVGNALDTRKLCDSVKWTTLRDDRNQTVVQYDCEWKGVKDSAFLEGESPKATSAADIWQWTFGVDDQPTLTGFSFVVRHEDGSVHDVMSGGLGGQTLASLITANQVADYDHAFSIIAGRRIPLKYQEPSSPIPDTTYGNKLAQFYHGLSSGAAAAFAYRWKKESVRPAGTDSLGYLQLSGDITNPAALYPVDPADVQLEFPLFQGNAEHPSEPLNYQPKDLAQNKLYCMGAYCFDYNDMLVGRSPPEVLAKEVGFVTDGYGHVNPVTQSQQSAPSQQLTQQDAQQGANAQPTALGRAVAQATQPNGSAQDLTANSLPVGAEGWPTPSPCIKKLEDAYRKDRQAHALDDSISMDQDNDFASTCKTVGQ